MSEPCKQEGNIGALTATVEGIEKTLERFVIVLEKIAAQGEKLVHIEGGQNLLFERVRKIELMAEGEKVKVGGIVAAISLFTSIVVTYISKHVWR